MFTQGQMAFAGFFIVTFIAVMIFAYRKDIKLHRAFYKGSYWVLLGFLAFIGLLFIIKIYMKH